LVKKNNIVLSILTLTFARLVINMGRRFPYPFLPEIARELSVPLDSVASVMAANAGIGIVSPLLGPVSERYGRKRVILGSLSFMAMAAIAGASMPQFWLFAVVMLAFGVGKMMYDPAMQAYIGDRVPYARRALAIGTTELSWAGALFIAAPIAGRLLEVANLQAVFAGLAAVIVAALLVVVIFLPADHPTGEARKVVTPLDSWRLMRENPAALGAMSFSLLLVMANEIFFINYGAWMEASFDLVLAALGTVTIVIAVAEVSGEFTVIGLADRLGKRRLTLIGTAVSSLIYVLLPHLTFSLPISLAALFVLFFCVEIAVVASISLFTEVLPEARSVMMSSNVGAHSLGRLTGALLGSRLYELTHSFPVTGLIAMVIGLGSLAIFWRFVQERHIPAEAARD
jgi:predicted MFS family arabinose efflux permease